MPNTVPNADNGFLLELSNPSTPPKRRLESVLAVVSIAMRKSSSDTTEQQDATVMMHAALGAVCSTVYPCY